MRRKEEGKVLREDCSLRVEEEGGGVWRSAKEVAAAGLHEGAVVRKGEAKQQRLSALSQREVVGVGRRRVLRREGKNHLLLTVRCLRRG